MAPVAPGVMLALASTASTGGALVKFGADGSGEPMRAYRGVLPRSLMRVGVAPKRCNVWANVGPYFEG